MNLGEKIKAARLERHMTQKDVVGDYITRNMLSKIENGSATPSVKTLEYLAGALGLPAGYFMNDSNGDELTPGSVASARNHFRAGEYEGCVQVLEELDMEGGYKDEAMLLMARAKIGMSKKAMIVRSSTFRPRIRQERTVLGDSPISRATSWEFCR